MKIFVYASLIFICLSACRKDKLVIENNDCKVYYAFLRENWVKKDSLYSFKNETEYWRTPNYGILIKEKCLIGLTKRQIIKLLGKPTKTLQTPTFDTWVYCLDGRCYMIDHLSSGATLTLTFVGDTLGFIITRPVILDLH